MPIERLPRLLVRPVAVSTSLFRRSRLPCLHRSRIDRMTLREPTSHVGRVCSPELVNRALIRVLEHLRHLPPTPQMGKNLITHLDLRNRQITTTSSYLAVRKDTKSLQRNVPRTLRQPGREVGLVRIL